MRAALYDRHGASAEVLRVEDIEAPVPGPGEVRVRIEYSGVNPTDWKSRGGSTPRPIDGFQIPHHDGAGVIDAVGEGVDAGRVGQRAWTWMAAAGRPWGTAAQWSVVPAGRAVPLPDGISAELGASLGVPAVTAHRCLFADGQVDGKTILVAGGAGAVGHFAIELAKFAGARVITTVSGPEKAELAGKAGADLVINYREPSAAEGIGSLGPVDRVIEVALGSNLALDLAVLRPGGEIVTYAAEPRILPCRSGRA
jgi:NADPH2:quinone reductase